MRRFKTSLFFLQDRLAAPLRAANVRERFSPIALALLATVLAVAALAQTASEKPSLDTRRVGSRLACQCGCKDSVATCSMLECSRSEEHTSELQSLRHLVCRLLL